MNLDIGKFDLDVTLKDAAFDPHVRPARRMIANACIGMEAFDAYYSVRELAETLNDMHAGVRGAKARLAKILSTQCDDFQRCIYYSLAGRGGEAMLEDLAWLLEILEGRSVQSAALLREGDFPLPQVNPYVAPEPDGPVVSATDDFTEGASWHLDPGLRADRGDTAVKEQRLPVRPRRDRPRRA